MSFQWSSTKEFNEKFDLLKYVEENYGARFNGQYIVIPCPFHSEETGSCVIYSSNTYHCFGAGCGAHGNAFEFIQKTTGLSESEILGQEHGLSETRYSIQHGREESDKARERKLVSPKSSGIKRYNKVLLKSKEKLAYLYKRHFDRQTIERAMLGYVENPYFFSKFTKPRYSIPVYQNGELISARYRIDPKEDDGEEPKYLAHPNAPVALYNYDLLDKFQDIVVVGSELDASFLWYRYGIYAVAPPGEGNFKREWAYHFTDHNVLIWLDYDNAGVKAAIKTHNILRLVCKSQIYVWDGSYRNKDDICDFVTRESIIGVVEALDRYNVKAYN